LGDLREKWVAGPRESLARTVSVGKDGDGSGTPFVWGRRSTGSRNDGLLGHHSSGDDSLRGLDGGEGGRQSVDGEGDGGEGRIWEMGEILIMNPNVDPRVFNPLFCLKKKKRKQIYTWK